MRRPQAICKVFQIAGPPPSRTLKSVFKDWYAGQCGKGRWPVGGNRAATEEASAHLTPTPGPPPAGPVASGDPGSAVSELVFSPFCWLAYFFCPRVPPP